MKFIKNRNGSKITARRRCVNQRLNNKKYVFDLESKLLVFNEASFACSLNCPKPDLKSNKILGDLKIKIENY